MDPTNPKGQLNLGIALAAQGLHTEATEAFEKVLQLDSTNAFGNYNLARLCYLQNNLTRAQVLLTNAIKTKPDFSQAMVLLANVLDDQEKTEAAITVLERALQLNPFEAGIWFNHAVICRKILRLEDSENSLIQAMKIAPTDLEVRRMLSRLMRDHGLAIEALNALTERSELNNKPFHFRSEELFLMGCSESISAADLYQKHLEFGRDIEHQNPIRFHAYHGTTQENRRLRVGFVSSDFSVHPVSLFVMPLLEKMDREQFELICYSSGHETDHITEKIRLLSDQWQDAVDMSDTQLSDAIHADAVDILIDLGGHSSRTRLVTFSEKPAPIQATWLGYLNTTGLTRIDYRICDARTDPIETSQALHSEKLLFLPNSQWCYRPFIEVPPTKVPPNELNGYITFGSFNSALKLTDEMLVRWAHILRLTPNSRLLFAGINSNRKRQAILKTMKSEGVEMKRIEFSMRVDLNDYYELISSVDIALDSFPYGGGTTTFDCLWMGVPVVTAMGDLPTSRSAASILSLLGLDSWISPSITEFVNTAVASALKKEDIAYLRKTIRETMLTSPAMNEVEYVRNMEKTYRSMWSAHCQGLQYPTN
jgi:predicted O-linked N-acetylglucosamine transferase (SPINDLY family)